MQRSTEPLFSEVDGEIVMLSIENSEYYHLDPTGRDIWNLLSEPRSFRELIAALMEEYDVSAEQCRKDVTPFLKALLESGIIKVHA
ncbi:MAG: lasso peptide biosynthesis PqqD family chaperone [Bacteroidales bacterium]|nr:lasso peptide biosynthesis PqqD family chaperone [Bacteroidales bacterium]MBN2698690.1 lasso peptide biosynthesis PqqD family chaperone [Bacteroidales bacterium]